MSRICISFATSEGQTERIAEYIADLVRHHDHEADLMDIRESADVDLGRYDGIIVGASIHRGKHDKHVAEFVEKNLDTLERVPSAFFSVSLAAHGDTGEAERYLEEFEEGTTWRPARVALFSGALLYTQYGFLTRHLMKRIAGSKPGALGTDTSRDYVYTEWDGVRRFTEDFLSQVAPGQDAPGVQVADPAPATEDEGSGSR